MTGTSIKLDNKKVKKRDFRKIKKAFKIDDRDVNKKLVCKK